MLKKSIALCCGFTNKLTNNNLYTIKTFIMEKHKLHKKIGNHLAETDFGEVIKVVDQACGGKQNIPLFLDENKSNKTEICNVDFMLIKNNKIKVIIEIEESNIKPTQILGKLMTSAIANYYIHENSNNQKIEMSNEVSFIQILNTEALKNNSSKIPQWNNIENSVTCILKSSNLKIKKYKLFYGNVIDINLTEISDYINNIINDN